MLPYFANKQFSYTNDVDSKLTVTSVRDKDYHISIQTKAGNYECMVVPADIFEEIMCRFITEQKSVLVYPDKTVKNVESLNPTDKEKITDEVTNSLDDIKKVVWSKTV